MISSTLSLSNDQEVSELSNDQAWLLLAYERWQDHNLNQCSCTIHCCSIAVRRCGTVGAVLGLAGCKVTGSCAVAEAGGGGSSTRADFGSG